MIVIDGVQAQHPADLPEDLIRASCEELERGGIVYFTRIPLQITEQDLAFLRAQKQSDAAYHKNIAYRPLHDRLTGYAGEDEQRMQQVLRAFSTQALDYMRQFLRPYQFDVEYASFRPLQEANRKAKQNARNDLIHVDSFPTRPTHGKRILRFFTNIHPSMKRVWKTGPAFPELARRYAESSGLLQQYRRQRNGRGWREALAGMGLPVKVHPAYDQFMHGFHNWLKANSEFQNDPSHPITEMEPLTSWMAITDTASHAVLSGQYALEQTILIHPESLLLPEQAPNRVLEALAS